MRVLITGRHVDVTPALRRYIDSRSKRLARYGARVGKIQVVLGVEKYRHTAEILVHFDGALLQSKAATREMYSAIDELFDRVAAQVRRRKEKRRDHKGRARTRLHVTRDSPEPETAAIKTVRRPLETLTIAEAKARLEEQGMDAVVFVNSEVDRIQVLRRAGADQLELLDPAMAKPGQA
jgi:putative sigma-54 modulation protein